MKATFIVPVFMTYYTAFCFELQDWSVNDEFLAIIGVCFIYSDLLSKLYTKQNRNRSVFVAPSLLLILTYWYKACNIDCITHLPLNFLHFFLSNKKQSNSRRWDKLSIVSADLISECNWGKVIHQDINKEWQPLLH